MIWNEAKLMAIHAEAKLQCSQIRIAAFTRKIANRSAFLNLRDAVTCISKSVRGRIAKRRMSNFVNAAENDRKFRRRYFHAMTCQKAWRRYYWRNFFLEQKRMRAVSEVEKMRLYRVEMNGRRKIRESRVVFRQVRPIQATMAKIRMFLWDKNRPDEQSSLAIKVYVPLTQETFQFELEESTVRDCLETALVSDGKLSWDEMLKFEALSRIAERLMVRIVNRRPIILFSRRSISERGMLISKSCASLSRNLYVLSVFRSPFDFVFCAYDSKTCMQLRTKIETPKLRDWLHDEGLQQKNKNDKFIEAKHRHQLKEETQHTHINGCAGFAECFTPLTTKKDHLVKRKSDSNRFFLTKKGDEDSTIAKDIHQDDLVLWLTNRLLIEKDQITGNSCLLLQCDSDEKKKIIMTKKVQSIWRRVMARKEVAKIMHTKYEKGFDRKIQQHYYIDIKTGSKQWLKPRLIGSEDIKKPKDEWRCVKSVASGSDGDKTYYVNLATGQSSWFSEEYAARMVQKKFRGRLSRDLFGSKPSITQVAKAAKFIHDAEYNYEKDQTKVSHCFNFALLCHCIKFDFEKARLLYKDVLRRSPYHPVIGRAYGIFLHTTCEAPFISKIEKARDFFREAKLRDPDLKLFNTAIECAFHWAVVAYPSNVLAVLNYALLQQCILGNYKFAEKLYRKALSIESTNRFVVQNYESFEEQRYPGGAYASNGPSETVVKRSVISLEQPEWGEWQQRLDEQCTNDAFRYFWYNSLRKEAYFDEPIWDTVWKQRVKRSRIIGNVSSGSWIEYRDDKLRDTFFLNRCTGEFVSSRGKSSI